MGEQAETNNGAQGREFKDPLTGVVHQRASFAEEVRGTEAKAIDFTMAKLAQDVYRSQDQSRPPIDGWTALSPDQLRQVGIDPKLMHDKKSGYDAAVYTDNEGRYVVAYRGTDQAKDWKTNLGQGLGFDTTQYNLATELGRQAKVAFGENVAFVGHSLGGGLAATAMAATDSPGMTFNAAGLSDKTLKRLGFEPDAVKEQVENGQIRNYQVKGEILTHLQEKNIATRWVMPDAIGRDMPLPDPAPLKGIHNINPFEKLPHRVDLHSMETVLESWQMKHGDLLAARAPTQTSPTQTSPMMTDSAHPANTQFERANGELGPKLQSLGLSADQALNVSADLTLQTQRDGVTPVRFELGKDQLRAFAVPEGEAKPYSQVVVAESKDKPLAETSRESAALATPNPTLAANDPQLRAQPAPDQSNPEIGGLARGAR